MAENVLTKWYAEFAAKGLNELKAAVKELQTETAKSAAAHERYAKAAADPAFRKAAEHLESVRRRTAFVRDLEAKRLDLAVRTRAVRTGAFAEELRGLQNVAREQAKIAQLERAQQLRVRHAHAAGGGYAAGLRARHANDIAERKADRIEERARLAQQRSHVGSAAFGREVRDNAALEREREDLARATRRAELVALHGRTGGAAMAFAEGRGGRIAHGTAATTVAVGGGMVRQGFSGTVEGNRLALEGRLASREMAAAFKPMIQAATWATKAFRERMEKQSSSGQNAVMVGGMGLSAMLAFGAAKKVIGLASRLTGGGAAAASLAPAAPVAAAGTAAGTTATAAAQGSSAAASGSRAAAIGRFGARLGAVGMAASAAYYGYQAYEDLSTRPTPDALGRIAGRGIRSGLDFVGGPSFGRGLMAAEDLKAATTPGGNRRQVLKADAGFDEIGSSYDRLSNSLAMTDTSWAGEPNKDSAITKIQELIDEVKRQGRVSEAPQFQRGG